MANNHWNTESESKHVVAVWMLLSTLHSCFSTSSVRKRMLQKHNGEAVPPNQIFKFRVTTISSASTTKVV